MVYIIKRTGQVSRPDNEFCYISQLKHVYLILLMMGNGTYRKLSTRGPRSVRNKEVTFV